MGDAEASIYRNKTIGYIPQGQSTLANLTVLDNVRLPFHLAKRDGDGTGRALMLLEDVGISHLADSFPRHLSGGEQKRVAVARALMNAPEALFADEPTSDLDEQTTAQIMLLLQSAARNGTAVLMVTHESDTLRYGNKSYEMRSGILSEIAV
jgi:putative ABC transport system ATP-binding protein